MVLSGCASHEGNYAPDCVAFAGDKITLSGGEFVWDKFTDEVIVNDEGEVVDQFPGYPLRGTYRLEGDVVVMETAGGEAMESMYLHQHDDHTYLYTAKQFDAFKSTGQAADCALVQK